MSTIGTGDQDTRTKNGTFLGGMNTKSTSFFLERFLLTSTTVYTEMSIKYTICVVVGVQSTMQVILFE